MKIISPITIDDTTLSATNVAETVSVWSATTYYTAAQTVRIDATHTIYEALIGDASATVTITIASPGVVTHSNHGLVANTPVKIATTGALPTGLTQHTTYYVRNPTTSTYELSATSGGASINTSGTQSGTHTAYPNPNRGVDPTLAANSTYWLDTGSTNPWAMFDPYLESQTTNATSIAVTVIPTGRVDALALFNLDASSVNVTVTDATDGELYNVDFSLVSNINVGDWYDYFFQPIIRKTALLVEGLPAYVGPDIDVTITSGTTAKCGALVMGSLRDLGGTVYGADFGIIDHSLKTVDDFGRTTITQRSYRKAGNFRVVVPKNYVGEVDRILTERRAVYSAFSGTGEYASTLIYGFPRDWRVTIEHLEQSALTIEIEGVS